MLDPGPSDNVNEPRLDRRALLRAAGVGTTLSLTGDVAVGQNGQTDRATESTAEDAGPPADESRPGIHPSFGYPGLAAETVPDHLDPDHLVELLTRPPVEEAIGDFVFDPVGLHVETGAIVNFAGTWPEHTATAYHNAQGRWHRVPEDLPPVSSPVISTNGFWLYRFDEPGVYDLFCAPHEQFGMVMRIVVGDRDEWTIDRNRNGRPPLEAAQTVFDRPQLAPDAIVSAGSVAWDDLSIEPADSPTPEGSPIGPATPTPTEFPTWTE